MNANTIPHTIHHDLEEFEIRINDFEISNFIKEFIGRIGSCRIIIIQL